MSNIRFEFYQAVNKANLYQPKPKPKKVIKESISIEEQIVRLLNEESAVSFEKEKEVHNEKVVDYLYNLTKKDELTIQKEKEIDRINAEREVKRKEWVRKMKMMEVISVSAAASSSAAAGAGAGAGGGGGIAPSRRKPIQKYFEMGYIEDGYTE